MGNIEDFAAQLAGEDFQKQLAAENPYFHLQQAPDLVGSQVPIMLAKNPGKYSTSQALALALGSGLFSGALRGLGDNYQSEKTDQYQKAVQDLAVGNPVDESSLPSSIFRKAQDAVNVFRTRKVLADQQAKDDAQIKLDAEIAAAQNPELLAAEKERRRQILLGDLSPEITDAKARQAAAIESATGSRRAGARTLSDAEKDAWGAILNLSDDEKSTLHAAEDIDRIRLAKASQGEKIRPPSPQELSLITSNDNFRARISDIKSLVDQVDDNSIERAIKGGKGVSWYADTESPEYKLYTALGAAKQQFAKATLGSQISDFDVRTWIPAFEGIPLLDSKKAIKDRLGDIEKQLNRSKLNTLTNLKKGLVNVENFDSDKSDLEASLAEDGSPPTPPPGYELTGKKDAAGNYGIRKKK